MRERSVEPDAHLVFDAPRVKPIPVDIRSAELGPGEEVGDLQGVEFTRYLVVAANRMLVPDVPVSRLVRPIDLAWENLLPENGLPDAVELVIDDLIAGNEPVERFEQRPRERVGPVDRARLAEELDHGLQIRVAEPRHGASENTTNVVWTQPGARRILNFSNEKEESMKRMFFVLVVLALVSAGAASSTRDRAQPARHSSDPNAVLYWSQVAESTISVGRPPASSEVLNGLVHAVIYDAVVSVEGEYEPFAVSIRRFGPTSVDAAVAAAARGVLVTRVPGQAQAVEDAYATFIAGIPDGSRKTNGIRLGQAVAGRVSRASQRRRLRQRRSVGAADAGPRCVRADPVQQHPGRYQAEAGAAAGVRRQRRGSGRTARTR